MLVKLHQLSKQVIEPKARSNNHHHRCCCFGNWIPIFPQTVGSLGVLTVMVKGRCLIEVSRGRVRLIRCYLQCISRNPRSTFRLRMLAEYGAGRVLVAAALSLWCRALFRTWWSLFVAGARETSCFGGPKSTFVTGARDRSGFTSKCSTLDMVVIFHTL